MIDERAGRAGTVLALSNAVVATDRVGVDPFGVGLDVRSGRAYTADNRQNTISVVEK